MGHVGGAVQERRFDLILSDDYQIWQRTRTCVSQSL